MIVEVRYLLLNAEMECADIKKQLLRYTTDKKRLNQWRTDHVFRFQELKLKSKQYEKLNVADIKEARHTLEVQEEELQKLGIHEAECVWKEMKERRKSGFS